MAKPRWLWAGPGGRRQVFAALAPSHLFSRERKRWIAPFSYRVRRDELALALVAAKPPPREQVLADLDELFLILAKTEQAMKEADAYLPLDVAQAWEEAGASIIKAKALVEDGGTKRKSGGI